MENPSGKERDSRSHWDAIYKSVEHERLSWHQQCPRESLEFIEASAISAGSPVIDVGGGTSLLAETLLRRGYEDITVLDCSPAAIDRSRSRLGPMAEKIRWSIGDVRSFRSGKKFMLWHDRAAFHFMVDPDDRRKYLESLNACLDDNGHVVLGTFALSGPDTCSNLDVMRYDEPMISELFAPRFRVISSMFSMHDTPSGHQQDFMFFYLRRRWA